MKMNKIVLVTFIIATKTYLIANQPSDQYCKVVDDNFEGVIVRSLTCNSFTDFSQLNLADFQSNSSTTFTSLEFTPSIPLFFNNSLSLLGLQVDDTYVVKLQNINKFDILSNPFAILDYKKRVSLFFNSSVFQYLFEGNEVNQTLCNYLLINEIDVTLLDTADFFIMDYPTFSSPVCPFLFKAAKLVEFQVAKIIPGNQLSFIDSSLLYLSDFVCQIDNFVIRDSNFALDESLLNKQIFKELVSLTISNSVVNDIQNDIFKSFYKLRYAEFELLDFKKFIEINRNNDWMKYINSNITVNLTDESDINKNLANQFELALSDNGNLYTYPLEDFCYFKNFPHNKLVMPIINTKANLECSCTLMWLLQYQKIYDRNGVNPMTTDSTLSCLATGNFDKLVRDCNFDDKLKACYGIPLTTKSSVNDDGFKTATIILSLISVLLLVSTIFLIYWFKFRKNGSSDGSLSFSTFAADKKVIISS